MSPLEQFMAEQEELFSRHDKQDSSEDHVDRHSETHTTTAASTHQTHNKGGYYSQSMLYSNPHCPTRSLEIMNHRV